MILLYICQFSALDYCRNIPAQNLLLLVCFTGDENTINCHDRFDTRIDYAVYTKGT
jgi:hypothetical protein